MEHKNPKVFKNKLWTIILDLHFCKTSIFAYFGLQLPKPSLDNRKSYELKHLVISI